MITYLDSYTYYYGKYRMIIKLEDKHVPCHLVLTPTYALGKDDKHVIYHQNIKKTIMGNVPYTAKRSSGKTFAFFVVFQSIAKVFPSNHLLCTVHYGHGLIHRKSFPVNSVFYAQPQKFSHSKVLPYTVMQGWRRLTKFWGAKYVARIYLYEENYNPMERL